MENLKEELKCNKKGITLISLVVTIVVLLILAGVSIGMLTGDNGILKQATKAKEETKRATIEEQRQLAMLNATMNTENQTYTDKNGDTVIIPAGFAVTGIDGEDTIDNGLVIIDSKGNEFVWIEVPRTNEVYLTSGINITNFSNDEYISIESDLHSYVNLYRNNTTRTDTYYTDETTGLTESEYNLLKQTMLKSIYEHEGFWIGRYEASTTNPRTNSAEILPDNIMSQANLYPLTYITCSEAQILANNAESGNYTSSLMFGIQWDLTLKYLETTGTKQEELLSDSSNWGNYINSEFKLNQGRYTKRKNSFDILWHDYTENFEHYVLETIKQSNSVDDGYAVKLTTGATNRNCKNNIYDLAGNVRELTLENSTSNYNVTRGGSYELLGNQFTVNRRNNDYSGGAVGFRISLF